MLLLFLELSLHSQWLAACLLTSLSPNISTIAFQALILKPYLELIPTVVNGVTFKYSCLQLERAFLSRYHQVETQPGITVKS